jgi:hypothetical protein
MPMTIDEEPDAELDRILGNKLLFDLTEPQCYGGPSVPTLYRMRRDGRIEFTKSGALSKLNRETMKRVCRGIALTTT